MSGDQRRAGQRDRRGFQREPERLQGRDRVFKGTYTETMTAAIAAFRAGEQPHIVQVFEVGTATMMAAKGAIYPVHQLMADAGEPFDPDAYLPAVTGYYTHRRRPDAVDAVQQLDPGALLQQGRLQEGRARPRAAAQDLGRAGRRGQEDPGRGLSLRLHHRLAVLDPGRERRAPGTTSRSARRQNGFDGLDTELVFNQNDVVPRHIANLAEWQTDEDLRLRRPPQRGGRQVLHRRLRHVHRVLGRLRRHAQANVKGFEFGVGDAALLRRHRGRAAELDHRRRAPVGAAGQERGGVQGRRPLLQLSVVARGAGRLAPGDRLPADHHGGLRADQGAGLLRQEPRHRDRDPADHAQSADRELEGPALRQLRADPRHRRRGAGGGLERRQETRSRRSTRRSRAATSCCGEFEDANS